MWPWWGEPDRQAELIAEDLTNPSMTLRIVALEGRPFAYVQDYDAHAWPAQQQHFARLPTGTRGLDLFLGETDLLGQGHAGGFIRGLGDLLIANGAPALVTDPHPDNRAAVGAYRAGGLVGDRVIETTEGPAVLMVRRAQLG